MKEGQNGLAKKGNGEIMTRQALVPRWQIESRVDGCIDGWMDGYGSLVYSSRTVGCGWMS